ncbi:hypothetical protein JCM11641_006777 [Rhodosporidiobolus odoratus]
MPPKLTNPLRPVGRYRPGKAPVPVASDSDSDQDQDEQQQQQDADDQDRVDQPEAVSEYGAPSKSGKGKLNVALKEVEVDTAGKVKVGGKDEVGRTEMESSEGEYETDSDDEPQAPAKPVFRPQAAAATAEEDSSEYETDSEEEEPLKPIYKPVFVSKRNRDTIAEREKELDPEVQEAKRAAEVEKQREASKNLVADSIVRELAQKEAEVSHPDVDDTDGLDPEAEFEEWKLRELQRLKRDREARYALEKIREEVEARRAMPEELRLKEDTDRADQSRKAKEQNKGQKAFLERYHHKGVFHSRMNLTLSNLATWQDLEILSKRDYTAPTSSTITDVSSLPAVMQKRNFGKAHQTKYTHLAAEDTSRGGVGSNGAAGGGGGWGKEGRSGFGGAGAGAAGQGCFNCGGPHLKRDCPQLADNGGIGGGGGPSASGSNSSALAGSCTSYGAAGGWGARAARARGAEDRYAPSSGSTGIEGGGGVGGGGAGGRRGGPGLGYGNRNRDGNGHGAGDGRRREGEEGEGEPSWRDRGGPSTRRRERSGSRERRRSRSRSRSPPPLRYRGDGKRASRDDRDDRRRRDDEDRRYRRRSRSRSPPRRDRERERERERDRDGGRGEGGGKRDSGRESRDDYRDRDDKRRKVEYD